MYCETLLERIRNQYYSVIPRGTEEARIIDSITQNFRAEYMKDEKNPLQLLFKISMSVKKGKDFIPLVFETVMGMDGIIYVNSSSQN